MRVNSLFCFRLKTAGVIIGWLEVVGALLLFLIIGIAFGYAGEIADQILKQGNINYTKDELVRVIFVLGSIQLLISAVQLISAAMLIMGTTGERHLFLVPWLVNDAISLFFTLVMAIIMFTSGPTPQAVGLLLGIPLRLYVWIAMKSLFVEIKEDRERGRLIGQPVHNGYTNIQ